MIRLFVDNLTVIDFSYFHITRGILGESWIVDIELEGELDAQGMVFDFGDVKKTIKNIIDHEADHKFILPAHYSGLTVQQTHNDLSIQLSTITAPGEHLPEYEHHSPADAVLLLPEPEITQETLARFLTHTIKSRLPDNVSAVHIHLRTEIINGASYHYSHGLKKHKGNCQRIAHGHRSRIEIYLNDQRNEPLEYEWSKTFEDIYIGTREDISEFMNHSICFRYQAEQGEFYLSLPRRQCYLIDTDSTVEWIANHIAGQIKAVHPEDSVRVHAFEGVGKGAIAVR